MAEFKVGVTTHRDNTYSLGVDLDHGTFTPDDLITMAEIAKRHNVNRMMATTAKKISFFVIQEEDVNPLWDDLKETFGDRIHTPKGKVITCPGRDVCKSATKGIDPEATADAIDLISRRHAAGKVKVGVSSCTRNCAMPMIRDIGIYATAFGWTVTYGGNAANRARIGDKVAEKLNQEEMLALVEKLYIYTETFKDGKERSARIVERLGIDHLKKWLEEN